MKSFFYFSPLGPGFVIGSEAAFSVCFIVCMGGRLIPCFGAVFGTNSGKTHASSAVASRTVISDDQLMPRPMRYSKTPADMAKA